MSLVYLDNNATTRPAPEVVAAMVTTMTDLWGNPSSVHRFGQLARRAIDEARGRLAILVGCAENEIIFTGGGTESINTAIRGLFAARAPRKRILTSSVEHSATRELCAQMEKEGAAVVRIGVDRQGSLDLDQLRFELTFETALVSLMWANNETGVLFPVQEVGALCRAARVPFHCDATQAVGKIPVNFAAVPIDALSLAGHKFQGPKGIGALVVRRGVRIRPLSIGGPQERNRRGGTENVPGIVGLGAAAELALNRLPEMPRVSALRDRMERSILASIPGTCLNGDPDARLPNTSNIGFPSLQAEAILLLLSEQGICASAGAACSSGSLEPSVVLRAMGIDERIAHGSVRFSLSHDTTDAEVDFLLERLPAIIARLSKVLPV